MPVGINWSAFWEVFFASLLCFTIGSYVGIRIYKRIQTCVPTGPNRKHKYFKDKLDDLVELAKLNEMVLTIENLPLTSLMPLAMGNHYMRIGVRPTIDVIRKKMAEDAAALEAARNLTLTFE